MITNYKFYFSQTQFIQMWRTLYDIFSDTFEEQDLYHGIATVGTLLLQIGEVGKRFRNTSSCSTADNPSPMSDIDKSMRADTPSESKESGATVEHSKLGTSGSESSGVNTETPGGEVNQTEEETTAPAPSATTAATTAATDNPLTGSPKSTKHPDNDWSITFEQLLANLLNEPVLVDFFEKTYDLTDAIAALRNRRLVTQLSSSPPAHEKTGD